MDRILHVTMETFDDSEGVVCLAIRLIRSDR